MEEGEGGRVKWWKEEGKEERREGRKVEKEEKIE